jgi:hypothetical protein
MREFLVGVATFGDYHLIRLSKQLQAGSAPLTGSTVLRLRDRTLPGDRKSEWAWTLAHVRSGPRRVPDFGSPDGTNP